MCGRYTVAVDLDDLVEELDVEPLGQAPPPRYNVAPTQDAPVVTGGTPGRLELQRWGLVPPWAKDMSMGARAINARAETLAKRPMFRDAYRRRRCLVPADGFYEWKRVGKGKRPFYVRTRDRRAATFAGLWERWKGPDGVWVRTFTIVTVPALGALAELHDRMPAVIASDRRLAWIDPERGDPDEVAALLGTDGDRLDVLDAFELYEVSPAVNAPANDDASLVDPLPDPAGDDGPLFRGA